MDISANYRYAIHIGMRFRTYTTVTSALFENTNSMWHRASRDIWLSLDMGQYVGACVSGAGG